MLIDGQEIVATKQANYVNGDKPDTSPITFGDGISTNLNGIEYYIMININCTIDENGASYYSPGKVIFTGFGNNGIAPSVSLVLTSIREVS